jgi:hypothetical protein
VEFGCNPREEGWRHSPEGVRTVISTAETARGAACKKNLSERIAKESEP